MPPTATEDTLAGDGAVTAGTVLIALGPGIPLSIVLLCACLVFRSWWDERQNPAGDPAPPAIRSGLSQQRGFSAAVAQGVQLGVVKSVKKTEAAFASEPASEPKYNLGDVVMAQWENSVFYKATITQVNAADGDYRVKYAEDGAVGKATVFTMKPVEPE